MPDTETLIPAARFIQDAMKLAQIATPQMIIMAKVGLRVDLLGPDRVEIVTIVALPENEGHGTRAMQALCGIADRYGVELYVEVSPETADERAAEGKCSPEKLREWYHRFGFEGDRTMTRPPGHK